jgi:hypothetical protein
MDTHTAQQDLQFIHDVVARTHRRMDPRAFHYVHWGLIVLIWFPLANWLQDGERFSAMIAVGVGAVVLGFVVSGLREWRLANRPRIEAENTFIAGQVARITAANIVAGMVLSGLGPSFGFIDGPHVPILWGLIYANMAFMIGVAYSRDFLVAGIAIFVGVVLAIVFSDQSGYILGPFMGLGMIVPGLRAEGRVRRMQAEDGGTAAAHV